MATTIGRLSAPQAHTRTSLGQARKPLAGVTKRGATRCRLPPQVVRCSVGEATFCGSGEGRVGTVDFQAPRGQGGAAAASMGGAVGLLKKWNNEAKSLKQRINDLGLAGVASYGLFNTLYYISAFLFIWFFVTKVERGAGLAATARKLTEVLALTWAGSQVTKLARAGAALAMAPVVDKVLDWIKARLGLATKAGALVVLTVGCVALALSVFGAVVLVSA